MSIAESSGNLPAVRLRLGLGFPTGLGCFGLTSADGEIGVGAGVCQRMNKEATGSVEWMVTVKIVN